MAATGSSRRDFLSKQEVKLRGMLATQGQRIDSCVQLLAQTPNGCLSDHPAAEIGDPEMELLIIGNANGRLSSVRFALNKIQDGTYDFCDDCGKRIGRQRLAIFPDALRCIECQKKWERRPGATI